MELELFKKTKLREVEVFFLKKKLVYGQHMQKIIKPKNLNEEALNNWFDNLVEETWKYNKEKNNTTIKYFKKKPPPSN